MERLVEVIGPSPSEMSLGELEEVLKREHSRISKGLLDDARPTKRKAKAPSKTAKAKGLEKKFGMSLEEMERKLKLLKELEEKGGL